MIIAVENLVQIMQKWNLLTSSLIIQYMCRTVLENIISAKDGEI